MSNQSESPLRLKAGVDPAMAVTRLEGLVTSGRNVTAVAGGNDAIPVIRNAYLTWVEEVEGCLTSLTDERAPTAALFTEHFWRIRELAPLARNITDPRPFPLFYSEIAYQVARLERLLDDLRRRRDRAAGVGQVAVLDTHILLHYQPIQQMPWTQLLATDPVRLVIPLRVIEELDAKKYGNSDKLARRARNLLPALEQQLGRAGSPGMVSPGVTVEVPVDATHRERPADADEEILLSCQEIAQLSGRDATLVTADTGMRLRAQAYGLTTLRPPDSLLRVRDTAPASV